MKMFETPQLEVQTFAIVDIITTSGGGGVIGGGGGGNELDERV